MRVLFISPNTERLNMPTLPLGLALVAAATRRAGYQTRFLDLLGIPEPVAAVRQAIAEFQPEVIALSIRNVDDQSMQDTKFLLEPVRDVVAACRAASPAKIVVGGTGYSIFPEAALTYLDADYGVCGEGEVVFPTLLERIERGQDVVGLPGLYVCGGQPPTTRIFAEDLDLLPMPEADLWASADPKDPEVWVPVQTRRGCPLACSYCSTPELEGTELRMRSPADGRRAYRTGGQGRFPQALLRGQHLQPAALLRPGVVPPDWPSGGWTWPGGASCIRIMFPRSWWRRWPRRAASR